MPRQIIINATVQEARVATMESARLVEIQIERARERSVVGSIYKGRVTRVLPGIQAAFVDVGLEKAAFLPGADFSPLTSEEYALGDPAPAVEVTASAPETAEVERPGEAGGEGLVVPRRARALPPIEERLRKGQDIVVQIGKEPLGTKGARVTSNISLPGRYLVYLPFGHGVGVSRRIASEDERQRLREAVEAVAPPNGGVIIRTACEGVAKREIQADVRLLHKLWQRLARKAEALPAPALVRQELDIVLRTIRDLSTAEVARVVIDNPRDHQRILDFIDEVMPRARPRVELYDLTEPIFERFGVEAQIAKALERKVWLKSGGYIIIDQTEALTAVDVNTGRFIGKADPHDTVLRTNLEAARVIVDQLRLRNLGGLIIIDFIDMENPEHRATVVDTLAEALKSDKARATILAISELGLVEMTRQRSRESLAERLCEPCPTCHERGVVKAVAAIAYDVLRRIRREATMNAGVSQVVVEIHPAVAAFLAESESAAVRELEHELAIEILLHPADRGTPSAYAVTVAAATGAAG